MIYFDNAATSGTKPQSVIRAVEEALRNYSANPGRSGHKASQDAAELVYKTRKKLSDFFNAQGEDCVVFTANCTQSINFVLKGVLSPKDHIIVSDLEHNAVMRPLKSLGVDISVAKVSLYDDEITLENFKRHIKPNTKMIFCTAGSNVFGRKLPIKAIGGLCRNYDILFGVDAAQAAGVIPIDMKDMNIDYLCIAAHKGLFSPMGLGVLIANKPILKTVIEGGTGTDSKSFDQPNVLPEQLESGTVNLPAIWGLNAGLQYVIKNMEKIHSREMQLCKYLHKNLRASENAVCYADNFNNDDYLPVVAFNVKGKSSDEVAQYLSKNGVYLRSGLHCAPLAHIKLQTIETGCLRFAPSIFNTEKQVDFLLRLLKSQKI